MSKMRSCRTGMIYEDMSEYLIEEVDGSMLQESIEMWLLSLDEKERKNVRNRFEEDWYGEGYLCAHQNLIKSFSNYLMSCADDYEELYRKWGAEIVENGFCVLDEARITDIDYASTTLSIDFVKGMIKDETELEEACMHYQFGRNPKKDEEVTVLHLKRIENNYDLTTGKETERYLAYVENENGQGYFIETRGLEKI